MIIIRDSREQKAWDFSFYNIEQITKKLDFGDYSILGRETDFLIERKASCGELAETLGKDWRRFKKELERAKSANIKYIICEFPYEYVLSFPVNSGIPKKIWPNLKMNKNYLIKKIELIIVEYDIIFYFCNSPYEAIQKVIEIFNANIEQN